MGFGYIGLLCWTSEWFTNLYYKAVLLLANCVGSNIFLLALCVGLIMLGTRGTLDRGRGSTLSLTLTVWFGARFGRWIGALLLSVTFGFIVLIFTIIHRVVDKASTEYKIRKISFVRLLW